MEHITTYTGESFTPLTPEVNKIHIEDIAHALSMMCRANGHLNSFYTIAQHSINCAVEAKARGLSEKVQKACLLHDASEAYLSDITRPVKKHLIKYLEVEKYLQDMIYHKFLTSTLNEEELRHIEKIDHDMLVCEFDALMDKKVFDDIPTMSSKPNFGDINIKSVEHEFLRTFMYPNKDMSRSISVGIDAAKIGWVVACLNGNEIIVEVFSSINDLFNKYENAESVIIDIPIGLPECKTDVRPDQGLRDYLKGKASSVFNAPCRRAVEIEDYNESSRVNREVMGVGLSKQSHAICKKIMEVDKFLQNNSNWKNKLVESHPELIFAVLNKGNPVLASKASYFGTEARISILRKYLFNIDNKINEISCDKTLKRCLDDVLDAICLAVIGKIGVNSGFITIPKEPMRDKTGLLMQIVYSEVD